MSYHQQNVHKLNEFVPTYVPRSDFLPTNRVVDSNQADVQQWVLIKTISACQLRATEKTWTCLLSKTQLIQSKQICFSENLRKCYRQSTHLRSRIPKQSEENLIFFNPLFIP